MCLHNKPFTGVMEQYGIAIRRDGTWLHKGTPITRHNMVKLFARILVRDAAGDYWLETPYERGRISVEDAPFVITACRHDAAGDILLHTNIDTWVRLDAAHPLYMQDGVPYVFVRDNIPARIGRPVYYELAALAGDAAGVTSGGMFFSLVA